MNKIRTIIVDDEPLALDLLRSYLRKNALIDIIAECANGKDAIKLATELQPDLMLLDIQMPGLDGFEVIKQLQADIVPLIVFVTAYDRYALKAFDVHAVDYILKPLDERSVQRAISRCAARLARINNANQFKPEVIHAIEAINQATQRSDPTHSPQRNAVDSHANQKIIVKDRSAITLIDQQDIDWVDATGDYMCIHVAGVTHIMRSTLKNLLTQLNPETFKRVHRSTIINLSRIEKIIPHTKGEYFLELGHEERIKVSRNYRTVIKEYMANMQN